MSARAGLGVAGAAARDRGAAELQPAGGRAAGGLFQPGDRALLLRAAPPAAPAAPRPAPLWLFLCARRQP